MVNFPFSTGTVDIIFKGSIPHDRRGSFHAVIPAALNTGVIY